MCHFFRYSEGGLDFFDPSQYPAFLKSVPGGTLIVNMR
jgi:hypothetical protein